MRPHPPRKGHVSLSVGVSKRIGKIPPAVRNLYDEDRLYVLLDWANEGDPRSIEAVYDDG